MSERELEGRLRSAAFSLHGLHWRDRRWLLRQLLPAWRQRLRGLLRELRSLGVEPALAGGQDLPPSLASDGLEAGSLALIDQATPEHMRRLLAQQPESLQAFVLCLHDWRWRKAVWDGWSWLHRRRLLEQVPRAGQLRPALAQALLHALAESLPALNVDGRSGTHAAAAPSASSTWGRE
ncbi:hypothetical protein [Lacisediminimonas profundi]|uniref:hypothetical protein n=1 Tax=Lacisediminimonas profundi TaxID=2603856 RepID=UPI00124B64AC|nr:hypothetical protein [Lacisediminimonas profundi]